ncbi:RBBP9/YdeN family alpha/beta hydrolase [Novosphingobium sp. 9]|uniref:RBBP9/YdeN family alpha/beta hydrolase n=1 Tax=Novosphingobium sp. 9 TaxID=2025349 RepID=UPI0021B4EBF9|nr:alpha/beta hydrolase [Novosphingobium sp. 9]
MNPHRRPTAARGHPTNGNQALRQPTILLIPGLNGSGPDHWQSRWARDIDNAHTVELGLWNDPQRSPWINQLNLAIRAIDGPVVLVAHSLGCLVATWWTKFEQEENTSKVTGALLVAPPEVDFFPRDDRVGRFAPMPVDPLPFPSILVASQNDPWMGFRTAKLLARQWGSELVDLGEAGHINADSGLGDWPYGKSLLARLLPPGTVEDRTAPTGSGERPSYSAIAHR